MIFRMRSSTSFPYGMICGFGRSCTALTIASESSAIPLPWIAMVGMTGTPSSPESFSDIDTDPFLRRKVHLVYGKDHRALQFRELERKEEVPFKGRCIDNVHDHIRVVVGDELAGDLLLGREGGDGVDAREIDHPDPLATVLEEPLCPLDGLSRPVADLLVNTGELVEGRTLADIGISCKGHHIFAFVIQTGLMAGSSRSHSLHPLIRPSPRMR